MSGHPIDVLVVEDSTVVRMLLVHLLENATGIRVAGAVDSGQAALEFLQRTAVDVVLLDIHMEGMDGYETARHIMEDRPVPVVMCSAVTDPREVATAFRAYEAGAVAVIEKPAAFDHPDFRRLADNLLQTVRLMSEVKVVRRWPRGRMAHAKPAPARAASRPGGSPIVGIGASTGGPPALQVVLGGLDKDFPAPILIVQHITSGFLPGLAEWLGQTTALQVQVAANGLEPKPGHVYLAPDDFHLAVDDGLLQLSRSPAENGLRPSVDHLFRSLAHRGAGAVGVLLTGMGRDGAEGLRAMRDQGALTLAQDRATSVIHGMPGAAIGLDAATEVLPIERIADALTRAMKAPRAESRMA